MKCKHCGTRIPGQLAKKKTFPCPGCGRILRTEKRTRARRIHLKGVFSTLLLLLVAASLVALFPRVVSWLEDSGAVPRTPAAATPAAPTPGPVLAAAPEATPTPMPTVRITPSPEPVATAVPEPRQWFDRQPVEPGEYRVGVDVPAGVYNFDVLDPDGDGEAITMIYVYDGEKLFERAAYALVYSRSFTSWGENGLDYGPTQRVWLREGDLLVVDGETIAVSTWTEN